MSAGTRKPYRRSWKNLLLNKRYQLGFTLFMVGLSALLMAFLGYWVMREAQRATEVAISNVEGQRCSPVPILGVEGGHGDVVIDEITEMRAPLAEPDGEGSEADGAEAPEAAGGEGEGEAGEAEAGAGEADEPAAGADEAGEAEAGDAEAGAGEAGDAETGAGEAEAGTARERSRPRVVLDEGTMLLDQPPVVPPGFVDAVVQHFRCRHDKVAKIAHIEAGYRLIMGLLIGVGVLLILGLAVSGIKMTHHLAGPLYKVELYFAKMRDGRFDEVYDLRKGDQLVEFYEHFKAAHQGLKAMQREDIAMLEAVIEAADAEDLGSRSPELAAVLDELREALARKEKSLE